MASKKDDTVKVKTMSEEEIDDLKNKLDKIRLLQKELELDID